MSERLSLEESVGRMIWVGVRGAVPGEPVLEAEIERCLRAHVGGLILFDVDVPERDRHRAMGLSEADARRRSPRNVLSPRAVRTLTDYLRRRLGPHLLIAVDQEGGAVSRLNPMRGFAAFPPAREAYWQRDLDRARTNAQLAACVAEAGCDVNLAPCVDVAINPDGPGHVALGRSYGRDAGLVASFAAEVIAAHHHAGLAVCLKHFPGHGSARGDTHHGLVDITDTYHDDEMEPYRRLLGPMPPFGVGTADLVMVGHMVHRGLDARWPCSLSPAVIQQLLRLRLGFDGCVMTDSLDMQAIAEAAGSGGIGRAAVLAAVAGCDVILEGNNLKQTKPCPAPEIHAALVHAVRAGQLSPERIDESVRRLERLRAQILHRRAATRDGHALPTDKAPESAR